MNQQSATDVSVWKNAALYQLLLLIIFGGPLGSLVAADDEHSLKIIEYRDTHPSIDLLDSVRILSDDHAKKLQDVIRAAYTKLAPSVVRIFSHNDQGEAFDEYGLSIGGGYSGVIIQQNGLILTCSHHGLAPGTIVTVELSDGKRVAGKMLGRFAEGGPDIGLALLAEPNDWPAAIVSDDAIPTSGQICLAIGYPGTLRPGRPPLLRAGRFVPNSADWPWLDATTTVVQGDSGGPIFDLRGRIWGVLSGSSGVGLPKYESILSLKNHQARLEAGDLISGPPKPRIRALRGRRAEMGAFSPALDIEDRIQQVSKNVMRIMDGPHEIAAGLIVDKDGWAVTKASLIGYRQEWFCRVFYTRDGKTLVRGRVVANSAEHDLALMKLELHDWFDAPWANERPTVGTFVSSCLGRTAEPLQFATVGADAFPEQAKPNEIPQIPVSLSSERPSEVLVQLEGWKSAEFDAYRELFQFGDVITHLNGIATPTRTEYGQVADRLAYAVDPDTGVKYGQPALGSYNGEWVSVGIRRGTADLTVWIPRIHSTTMASMSWHAHPLSLRRESFPIVFSHDLILRPEQCGGPVVDLEGRIVGLNIARADETRTLAIPADVVRKVIDDLRERAEETQRDAGRNQ